MKVANRNTYKSVPGERATYVGRPSPLGNPFRIGPEGTREEVIEKYREWVKEAISFSGHAKTMFLLLSHSDVLLCSCAPLACHADVLVEMLGEE